MVLKNIKGSVLIEFALVVPILLVMIFVVQDIANYMIVSKNVEKIVKTYGALPLRLQVISEQNINVEKHTEYAMESMFKNLLEASKMIFYTNAKNLSKTHFPPMVLIWTLVECKNEKGNIYVSMPWRVFVKLTEENINDGKIKFDKNNFEFQTNVISSLPPEEFKECISILGTINDYKLAYKLPEKKGKILVLEVLDDEVKNKGSYLSGFVPKSWMKVHKISYNFISAIEIPSKLDTKLEGLF